MKKYGVRITLTEGNPLGLPHLLGENWESFRWYDTEAERDDALTEMDRLLPNCRRGDHPAQVLTKVER